MENPEAIGNPFRIGLVTRFEVPAISLATGDRHLEPKVASGIARIRQSEKISPTILRRFIRPDSVARRPPSHRVPVLWIVVGEAASRVRLGRARRS